MSEVKLCGVCNKNETTVNCAICGISLCDICKKEVKMEAQDPGHRIRPDVQMSTISKSRWKKIVCPKCMEEAEIY